MKNKRIYRASPGFRFGSANRVGPVLEVATVTVVTTGLILNLQNWYLFYRYESPRRYYQAYTYFSDTRVPLGTTGLILVLPIREYSWVLQRLIGYRSTRRYYRT